jgi:hypothetical protein
VADDAAFIWDQPTPRAAARRRPPATSDPTGSQRITLREAEHRFGVSVGTLRTWARKETIDAVRQKGSHGEQWMVTPESVAHHLSRSPSRTATKSPKPTAPAKREATGPSTDGSAMLVPRDAWDKLMDQLGNLHESGLLLAEARERAAKAETEASFLRERLAEMRSERDDLKQRPRHPESVDTERRARWWHRIRTP